MVLVKAVELAQHMHADRIPFGVEGVVDPAGQLVLQDAAGARLADPVVLPVLIVLANELGFLLRGEDVRRLWGFRSAGVGVPSLI